MKFMPLAALACAVVAAVPAQAAVTVYTSESAFKAAIGAFATDTFSDLTPGDLASPLTRTLSNGSSYTASANGPGDDGLFLLADKRLSNNSGSNDILFSSFSKNISALSGFFAVTDSAEKTVGNSTISFVVADKDGNTSYNLANPTGNFVGFVSTGGLASVTAKTVAAEAKFVTVGNLSLASAKMTSAVPEPATWAMMLVGFGLMGSVMRRKGGVRLARA